MLADLLLPLPERASVAAHLASASAQNATLTVYVRSGRHWHSEITLFTDHSRKSASSLRVARALSPIVYVSHVPTKSALRLGSPSCMWLELMANRRPLDCSDLAPALQVIE